ncbi:hypothetical protein [Tenacibaculum sp.]|uniref:DUF7738 domain-containing protein n=1 Tax=Tenacibaculum sp. TaxID=1906242 RepID=UPI003D13FA27
MNDTLEYQKFMTQEHRFELNGCNLKYNGKPFELGMSVQQLEEVFGENWVKEKETSENENEPYFVYNKQKGMEIVIEKNKVRDIYIFIQDTYLEYPNIQMEGNTTIMLNNTLLNQTDKMHEYIKRADTTFDEIGIKSSGYTFRYSCNNELIYFLDSPVSYHRKGGGHLYISGAWKLEETNEVKSIHIYYDEKI